MASSRRQFFLSHDQLYIEPERHYGEVFESKIAEYVLRPTRIFRAPLEVYRESVAPPPGNGTDVAMWQTSSGRPMLDDWRYGQWVLKNGRHRALAAITLGHKWLWCEEIEAPHE